MKCEICHKNEAEIALPDEKGNEELYVCKSCHEKETKKRRKKREMTRAEQPEGVDEPPPFVKEFFSAVTGLVNDIDKAMSSQDDAQAQLPSTSPEKMVPLKFRLKEKAFEMKGMMHLEGLNIAGHLDAVRRAVHALGLDLAGINTECAEGIGHIYNLMHHGAKDKQLAKDTAKEILRQECNARVKLFNESRRFYADALCRALAILKNARLLSALEYLDLLSPMRLAAIEKFLDGITLAKIENEIASINTNTDYSSLSVAELREIDSNRADRANKLFEDVILNSRAEKTILRN